MKYFLLFTILCQHSELTNIRDFETMAELNEFVSSGKHTRKEIKEQGPHTAKCSITPTRLWRGKELEFEVKIK